MYTCPECEYEINAASELCPHCGADLTPRAADPGEKPPSLARRLLILLAFAALIGSVWAFLLYIVPDRQAASRKQAETQAAASMREIARQLSAYAEATGGEYPASLEALGEKEWPAAQKARREGYNLSYTGSDVKGRIAHYVLSAQPQRYGFRSFYLDDSGVLRATRENRAATSDDPPA